jgi:hypothetical protein
VIVLLGSGEGEPTFELTVAGVPVVIAVAVRERLARLARVFQLVWATSWQRDGAESLGPLLGLSEDLPFLRFDHDLDHDGANHKLPVVRRFVGGRAIAWVDDELGEDVVAWAADREQPTLLIHTDPRIGLIDVQVQELIEFGGQTDPSPNLGVDDG